MQKVVFVLLLVALAVSVVAQSDDSDGGTFVVTEGASPQGGLEVARYGYGSPPQNNGETAPYSAESSLSTLQQPLSGAPSTTASARQSQKQEINIYCCQKHAKEARRSVPRRSHNKYGGHRSRVPVAAKPSIVNSYNKNYFQFTNPPGEKQAQAPPETPEERNRRMDSYWIIAIIVALICATIYGCTHRASQTELHRTDAETARMREAAERREAREAAERERAAEREQERLSIVREAVGNQGKFAPENSPNGLTETRTQIDSVGVLTSRADNRSGSSRLPIPQRPVPPATNANAAAGAGQAIDPNAATAAGANA